MMTHEKNEPPMSTKKGGLISWTILANVTSEELLNYHLELHFFVEKLLSNVILPLDSLQKCMHKYKNVSSKGDI